MMGRRSNEAADKTSFDVLAPSVPAGLLRDQASAIRHRVTSPAHIRVRRKAVHAILLVPLAPSLLMV